MTTTLIFYSIAILATTVSFIKHKEKTFLALKKAKKSFFNLLPALIPMTLFVGIMLTLVSPQVIGRLLGEKSGLLGVSLGAIIGSISFMPSFVAFSLGENLLKGGAGYPQVAVFVSTLMAVGVSSLSVELKYFDKKMTFYRNIIALGASLIFAFIISLTLKG